MKLYLVTVEVEVFVAASSAYEAEDVAIDEVRSGNVHGMDATALLVKGDARVPQDWRDALPFGENDPADPDRTVEKWIEVIKAEEAAAEAAKRQLAIPEVSR